MDGKQRRKRDFNCFHKTREWKRFELWTWLIKRWLNWQRRLIVYKNQNKRCFKKKSSKFAYFREIRKVKLSSRVLPKLPCCERRDVLVEHLRDSSRLALRMGGLLRQEHLHLPWEYAENHTCWSEPNLQKAQRRQDGWMLPLHSWLFLHHGKYIQNSIRKEQGNMLHRNLWDN